MTVAAVSAAAVAQDDAPTRKYSVSTQSFWSNWFVQANVSWNAFYVGGRQHVLSSPFSKAPLGTKVGEGHPTSLGFSLALGKWFTPGIGLRTKFNGLWYGRAFNKDVDKYMVLNEHVLFNMSNLFCGYNDRRLWNFIPYVGGGVGRDFDTRCNSLVWSAGVLNTFRLSRRIDLNLELGYVSYGKDIFSAGEPFGGVSAHRRNHQFTLEVGATVRLDRRGWKHTPDVDAMMALTQGELDALNAQLADALAENDRLRTELDARPENVPPVGDHQRDTVTQYVAAPVSVFFHIGQSTVVSRKELQSVADLAAVARKHGGRLVVTGYADSKTGSAAYNEQLSRRRAETIADELVKMGVDRSRVEIVAAGGVDTLAPDDYNRRVTVEIKQ